MVSPPFPPVHGGGNKRRCEERDAVRGLRPETAGTVEKGGSAWSRG